LGRGRVVKGLQWHKPRDCLTCPVRTPCVRGSGCHRRDGVVGGCAETTHDRGQSAGSGQPSGRRPGAPNPKEVAGARTCSRAWWCTGGWRRGWRRARAATRTRPQTPPPWPGLRGREGEGQRAGCAWGGAERTGARRASGARPSRLRARQRTFALNVRVLGGFEKSWLPQPDPQPLGAAREQLTRRAHQPRRDALLAV
jgi:hypothetical protein